MSYTIRLSQPPTFFSPLVNAIIMVDKELITRRWNRNMKPLDLDTVTSSPELTTRRCLHRHTGALRGHSGGLSPNTWVGYWEGRQSGRVFERCCRNRVLVYSRSSAVWTHISIWHGRQSEWGGGEHYPALVEEKPAFHIKADVSTCLDTYMFNPWWIPHIQNMPQTLCISPWLHAQALSML